MIKLTRRDGQTYAKLSDLRPWKNNPKETTKEDLERLDAQLELGEHSPLLVMADGTVLGGNSRLKRYKKAGKTESWVVAVEFRKLAGKWHAILNGVEAERTFESQEQGMLEYALSHNDMVGAYNEQKLADLLKVNPIAMEVYKISSVYRPVEDVAFEHNASEPTERTQDQDDTSGSKLDSYMNGQVKQIVFYFSNEQYEDVIPRLANLRDKYEVDDNTSLFLKLLANAEDAE